MGKTTKGIKEIRRVLLKYAWDANRQQKHPLLVIYPNEILLGLFGEELMRKYWIPDKKEVSTD